MNNLGLMPCEQLLTQVNHIYSPGEQIWIKLGQCKFFLAELTVNGNLKVHKTQLRDKENSKSRIVDINYFDEKWLLEQSLKRNGGLFYIPGNPQEFPLKECCYQSRDIGTEIDSGTREEQKAQYDSFESVSGLALLQVFSGSKSIHGHIILDNPISIERRTYLARLLCIALQGDPAVTNPHQPMRLAGGFRKEKGSYQELLKLGKIHTLEEVLEGLETVFKALDYNFPTEEKLEI